MLFLLLVDSFVGVLPLGVLVLQWQQAARFRGGQAGRQGVTADAGRDQLVGDRQAGGQQPRLVAGELEPEPVVAAAADAAVIVVLDVVGSTDDTQRVVCGGGPEFQRLSLLGRVVPPEPILLASRVCTARDDFNYWFMGSRNMNFKLNQNTLRFLRF